MGKTRERADHDYIRRRSYIPQDGPTTWYGPGDLPGVLGSFAVVEGIRWIVRSWRRSGGVAVVVRAAGSQWRGRIPWSCETFGVGCFMPARLRHRSPSRWAQVQSPADSAAHLCCAAGRRPVSRHSAPAPSFRGNADLHATCTCGGAAEIACLDAWMLVVFAGRH
jgi:hypothetical protein